MPRKHRTKTEIIGQIIQAAANGRTDGITKTRIMYSLFLSYDSLQEYLAILIQNGLLEYLPVPETYRTTEKGLKFLKLLEELQQELSPTTTASNNNDQSTRHDGNINKKKGVWQITAVAQIIGLVILSSFLSLAILFG
jgi:predicted transcriptional regulator